MEKRLLMSSLFLNDYAPPSATHARLGGHFAPKSNGRVNLNLMLQVHHTQSPKSVQLLRSAGNGETRQ
jgi:hypothetical protein